MSMFPNVYENQHCILVSSRTDICLVVSSRTELDDVDVDDVTSFSALDVVEIGKTFVSLSSSLSALDVVKLDDVVGSVPLQVVHV